MGLDAKKITIKELLLSKINRKLTLLFLIELKDSYYKQAVINLAEAKQRFKDEEEQKTLF